MTNFTDPKTVRLDAGSLGHFVRTNDSAGPVLDLQPRWMNKFGGERSQVANIHMGPNYAEDDSNGITVYQVSTVQVI